MDRDDVFEQALRALLAGEAMEAPRGGPLSEDPSLDAIRVLSAIGQTSRAVLFGVDLPERSERRWGHLEIREEIGRGSSGTVYRAWDTHLARDVALKLLDPDSASAHGALAEGRLLARVRHPHIVTVYGADTFGGVSGLWMELVEGDSLDDVLERDGPMGAADALAIGIDLAGALAAVHATGMLHRDVKARNVVRQRGGRLVLTDFGAGSGEEPTSGPTDSVGTPLYMAPEVLEGAPASVHGDIYGLGVLVYHLMTCSYPVAATDLDGLKAAHRSRQWAGWRVDQHHVPEAARTVIERACAPDAANRHASARELEEALGVALSVLVSDRAPVVPAPVRLWRRRRRSVLTTAAVAATVVLTVWFGWDSGVGRAARRLAGLPVPPRSPLYFVFGGAIGVLDGGELRLWPGSHQGATALAVTERFGVRTLAGVPPWIHGAWFTPDGRPARDTGTLRELCCFFEGTTDGRFNYALRQDSTLLEPIGSRLLAAPAIHRYTLEWTEPAVLFELGEATTGVTSGHYLGLAYAGRIGAFLVTRVTADGRPFLEQWSRDGRKLAEWSLPFGASGIAVDPADDTVWAARPDLNTRIIHLENFDSQGRRLGAFEIAKPSAPIDVGSLEFAWPATN